MEKVRPWCGQPSDRGRLKNRTEHSSVLRKSASTLTVDEMSCLIVTILSVTEERNFQI